jgi:hypothetical protein
MCARLKADWRNWPTGACARTPRAPLRGYFHVRPLIRRLARWRPGRVACHAWIAMRSVLRPAVIRGGAGRYAPVAGTSAVLSMWTGTLDEEA